MGIINDASPILHTDPKLVSIAKKRVIVGHRRPKILKDYLVISRLQYPPPQGYSIIGIDTCTSTKKTYIVLQRFTCRFNNLIYLITCMKCKSQYVSQTKNRIMYHLQQHLKNMEHCKNCVNAPPSAKAKGPINVGLHFNRSRHSVENVRSRY